MRFCRRYAIKTFVLNGWSASESAWDLCMFPRDRVFSYVEQLDGAPERALREEDCAVLVGWSMGGSTALRLAIAEPEKIRGLVLVAATARMMKDTGWAGMSERRLEALEYGLKMTRGEGFSALPEGAPNPYMLDDDANLARGLKYLRETDVRRELSDVCVSGRLRCPVHVFQSEHDGIVRRENADFFRSVFPDAVVEIVPGFEHALPVVIPGRIDAAVAAIRAASDSGNNNI